MSNTYNLDGYTEGTFLNTVAPWTGSTTVAVIGADGLLDNNGGGSVRHPTATNDMEIGWIGGTNVTHTGIALAVRCTDHYNNIRVKWKNSTTLALSKVISTVETEVATYVAGTRIAGESLRIRIRANGDTTVFYGGNSVMTWNFTEFSTVKNVGIASLTNNGSNFATSLTVTETFQDITSVASGTDLVTVGSTVDCAVTDFGTAVTGGTLDGVPLTSANNTTFAIPNLVDGSATPRIGARTLTLTDGTLVGSRQVTVSQPTGLSAVQLASNFSNGPDTIVYNFSPAAVAGDWIYFDPLEGIADQYGYYTTDRTDIMTLWHIQASTGIARSFDVNTTVNINRYGVASTLVTTTYPTATGITVDGKAVTGFSGSANSYNYTIPTLTAGAIVPRCGVQNLTITDGTTPTSYYVEVLPSATQGYVTLTNNGGTGVGFIGNYLTCVAGDQVVFNTPTSLGVQANVVTQTGVIQSDYSGNQTMWHIRASDGLVTELTIITPAVGVDIIPNQFTFVDRTQVAVSTVIESAPITVSGVEAATDVAISITGGEYAVSTDGGTLWGAFTSASTTVQLGHLVKVRVTTSSSFNTAASAVLTVGTVQDTFTATTIALDLIPNTFTFTAVTNAYLGSTTISNNITVTDVTDGNDIAISITGGQYSVNTGSGWSSFTSIAGVVRLNDLVRVQVVNSTSELTATVATLTIGTISSPFSSTTRRKTLAATTYRNPVTAKLESGIHRQFKATGTGFGSGPIIPFFDRVDAGPRWRFKTSTPIIGEYDMGVNYKYHFMDGRPWLPLRDPENLSSASSNKFNAAFWFGGDTSELFICYRMAADPLYIFPSAMAPNSPYVQSTAVPYKPVWLTNEANNDSPDQVLPSFGANGVYVFGNTCSPKSYVPDQYTIQWPNGGDGAYFDTSGASTVWGFYQGADNGTASNFEYLRIDSNTSSIQSHIGDLYSPNGATPNKRFYDGYVTINAQLTTPPTGYVNVQSCIADAYVAVGPNCRASVWASNSANWNTQTIAYVIPSDSWSSNEIYFRPHPREHQLGFYHIRLADGTIINNVTVTAV